MKENPPCFCLFIYFAYLFSVIVIVNVDFKTFNRVCFVGVVRKDYTGFSYPQNIRHFIHAFSLVLASGRYDKHGGAFLYKTLCQKATSVGG